MPILVHDFILTVFLSFRPNQLVQSVSQPVSDVGA